MTPELRARIIAYNKAAQARAEKAADMDALLASLQALPDSIRSALAQGRIAEILQKYGL